jgi:uncharacterized coiled-coil DUF342 family protein
MAAQASLDPSPSEKRLEEELAAQRAQMLAWRRESEEGRRQQRRDAELCSTLIEDKQALLAEVDMLRRDRQHHASHVALLQAQLWACSSGKSCDGELMHRSRPT